MEAFQTEKRRRWVAWAVVFSAAAILSYQYIFQVDLPFQESRIEAHHQILTGEALSPYRFRALVPIVLDPIIKAGAKLIPYPVSFFFAYALFELAAIMAMFGLLFSYLRNWFSREYALIGVLFAALSSIMAFRDHYFQPWSLAEAVLIILGLSAILRRRYFLLGVLTVLATANRETGLLLPLAFLFVEFPATKDESGKWTVSPKALGFSALFFLLGIVTFLGLRFALGDAPSIHNADFLLTANLHKWLRALVNNGLFLGVFWVFAVLGFREAPSFCKRIALVVPFYIAAVLRWGFWYEVRLLIPLYPVLIPLGLAFLANAFAPRGLEEESMNSKTAPD